MTISLNWLKNYIAINNLSIDEISHLLTDIGLEVESVEQYESVKGGLKGLIVGEVVEKIQHPNADRLALTKVNIGSEILDIVCGAPNVAVGQKVIVATNNTTLYPLNGETFTIKKSKIRGEISNGMICAEDEIGIGNSHDGIIVLPNETEIGIPANSIYNIYEDIIIEIGLTPNRTDAFSHIGVARDLLAAINFRKHQTQELQLPKVNETLFSVTEQPITISIENTTACPRYAGIVIENISVAPSPNWLQNKLKALGLKPINNIVDITNFVLHEFGQPLHAFDLSAITNNQIVVKTVANKTPFTTLDNTTIELQDTDLMICNAQEPMCIAGVYGGLHSGVKNTTTAIFLESAYFNPKFIRQTSTKHQLRTEAATHFEKGIDPNITITALKRAAQLIVEIANGKIVSSIYDIQNQLFPDTIVPLNLVRVQQLLGKQIPKNEIINILKCLDITIVEDKENELQVAVPAYRTDVKRPADVSEEILRIYGFNNIAIPSKINASVNFTNSFNEDAAYQTIANLFVANGFYEIMTNPLTKSTYLEQLSNNQNYKKEEWVHLLSSINVELDVLRNNMLFSGLESVAYNINHKQQRIAFFELAKSYHKKDTYEEHEHLVLYMSGIEQEINWNNQLKNTNFYSLKSVVQLLLNKFGITNYKINDTNNLFFDYGLDYIYDDTILLQLGKVNTKFEQLFGIKQAVYFATINWKNLIQIVQQHKIKYQPISKFPTVKRDLALLVHQNITFNQIETIAKQTAKKLLQTVDVFDIYKDDKIGKENKSYAVSFSFKDENKTLTDSEIDTTMKKLITKFEQELQATIR